jgi:hypothetical protein
VLESATGPILSLLLERFVSDKVRRIVRMPLARDPGVQFDYGYATDLLARAPARSAGDALSGGTVPGLEQALPGIPHREPGGLGGRAPKD